MAVNYGLAPEFPDGSNPVKSQIRTAIQETLVNSVDTISEIQSNDHSGTFYIITGGNASIGDGGNQIYYYDSADTTTADDGGGVLVDTAGNRFKSLSRNYADVRQWGAVPEDKDNYAGASNQTNNYNAIRNAIEWLGSEGGGTLYFPVGTDGSTGYFIDEQLRIYFDNVRILFDKGVHLIRKYKGDTTGTNIPGDTDPDDSPAPLLIQARVGGDWGGLPLDDGTELNNIVLQNVVIDGSRDQWDSQITSGNNSGFNGPTNFNVKWVRGLVMLGACKSIGAYKYGMYWKSVKDFYCDWFVSENDGGMGFALTGGIQRGFIGGVDGSTQQEGDTGVSGEGRAIHVFDYEPDDSDDTGDTVFDYEMSDVHIGPIFGKDFQSGVAFFPNSNSTLAKNNMKIRRTNVGPVTVKGSISNNNPMLKIGDGNVTPFERMVVHINSLDGSGKATNGATVFQLQNLRYSQIRGGYCKSYADGSPENACNFDQLEQVTWDGYYIDCQNAGGTGLQATDFDGLHLNGVVKTNGNERAYEIGLSSDSAGWVDCTLSGEIINGYALVDSDPTGTTASGFQIGQLKYRGHTSGDLVIRVRNEINEVSIDNVTKADSSTDQATLELSATGGGSNLPCRNLTLGTNIDLEIDYGGTYTANEISLIDRLIFRTNSATEDPDAQFGATELAIMEANSTVVDNIINGRLGKKITLFFEGTGNTLNNNTNIATNTGANKAFAAGESTTLIFATDSGGTHKWYEITQ